MTYLALCAFFVGAAVAVMVIALVRHDPARTRRRAWVAPGLIAAAVLLVLTAVFDNVMIALGIMQYGETTTSGLAVGLAPIEDFAYPIAAVLLLPAVWLLLERPPQEVRGAGLEGAGLDDGGFRDGGFEAGGRDDGE